MIFNIKKRSYISLAAIVVSAGMLCAAAVYNAFPLFFNSDTGMYIESANMGMVRFDRPILYGLFIMFTSLQHSLWLPVIAQALIVASVIHYYFRYFLPGRNYVPWMLAYMALISFFMKGSFIVSWLMPDVFTSVSILCIGLLLFVEKLKQRDLIIISLLSVLAIAMHNSHFFICLILSLLLFAGFIFKTIREKYKLVRIRMARLFLVLFLIVASNLFLSAVHYNFGGGFRSSRGGPVFLMGSLVDMGIMDTYLAENCGKKNYIICQYKDSIPSNFLWSDKSPLYLTGGWMENEPEYTAIVKDIITTPKYCKSIVYHSAILTFEQFFYFNTNEAFMPTDAVTLAMATYYPGEYQRFIRSKQSTGLLSFPVIDLVQTLIVAASLFIYIVTFLFNKMTTSYRLFILFIVGGLLVNAWVCGTISGVFPRYQARLIWLLPLPLFLYLAARIDPLCLLQTIRNNINRLYRTR